MNALLALLNSIVLLVPLLYTLITGLFTFFIGSLLKSEKLKAYGYNLLIGVDQMANVVLLGFPDETISGRTGRALVSGKAKWYIKAWRHVLDLGAFILGDGPNHSVRAIEHSEKFDERRDEELWHWSND